MVNLTYEIDRGRRGWRLRFRDINKKQHSIWLGKVSQRSAQTIHRHVSELVHASKAGVKPEADSHKWSITLEGRLRERLTACGLVEPSTEKHRQPFRELGCFVDRYIEERTDVRPSTITNYKHTKRWLVEFFGAEKLLTDVTPADCDRLQRFLRDRLADSTAEKILKRSKTMFRYAVRDRVLEENPFDDMKIGASVNRSRDFFVSTELTEQVLRICPDHVWKTVFGLARYGGLRTPSETLGLRWSDVEWHEGKIRIDSPKTGLRFCPLFPELASILREAREANPRSPWVVASYRGSEKNLRTQLRRLFEEGGLKPWPKLFVNLRASRRTELQEQFPDHVVNAWLGHSSRVAEKHYLQVTPDHWSRATAESQNENGGSAGGNISANPQGSTALSAQKKTGNHHPEGDRFPVIFDLAPPVGLEGINTAVA